GRGSRQRTFLSPGSSRGGDDRYEQATLGLCLLDAVRSARAPVLVPRHRVSSSRQESRAGRFRPPRQAQGDAGRNRCGPIAGPRSGLKHTGAVAGRNDLLAGEIAWRPPDGSCGREFLTDPGANALAVVFTLVSAPVAGAAH